MSKIPTADVSTGLVMLEKIRVHVNHESFLLGHDSVAFFDLLLHPDLELLAQDSGADINDELLRNLRQVDVLWQVVLDLWFVGDVFHDVFDGKSLVLRHVQSPHLVVLDILLLPADHVLQEIDRYVVYKKDM